MNYPCYDYLGIVNLRIRFVDIYRDFNSICQHLFGLYDGPFLGFPYNQVFKLRSATNRHKNRTPDHLNRVYITTDYVRPILVMADIRMDAINYLIDCLCRKSTYSNFSANKDCAILWVFIGSSLKAFSSLPTLILGELLTAFYHDNLICRRELRKRWVSDPINSAYQERIAEGKSDEKS